MNSLLNRMVIIASSGMLAAMSFAQVSQVGPFVGAYTETFDELPTQSQQLFLPNPLSTFGGEGSINITNTDSNAVTALAVYNATNNPFGNYLPADGSQFVVTQYGGDVVNLTFKDPMSEFGGYFGQDPLSVSFLDANGNVIGGGNYSPADNGGSGTLEWLGWSSTQTFSSVRIADADPNDSAIVMDSLQATPTPAPEPCTMTLMAGGAWMAYRKKRLRS